jgi:hypothetical protein
MKKRFTEEQIIGILREAERPDSSIRTVARKHNITDVTLYRWRNKYADGCATTLKLLCVLDEHTRECLGIEVGRWIRSQDVILTLSRLMKLYGKPQYIAATTGRSSPQEQSCVGSEIRTSALRSWRQSALAERLCGELQRQAQG